MSGNVSDIIETLAETIQAQSEAYGKLTAGIDEMHRVHGMLAADNVIIKDNLAKLIKKLKASGDKDDPKGFWGGIKEFFDGSLNKILVVALIVAMLIIGGARIDQLANFARACYGLPADVSKDAGKDEAKK